MSSKCPGFFMRRSCFPQEMHGKWLLIKQKNKSAGMSKNWSDGEWSVAAFCVPTKKVRRFGTQLLRFTVIYCSYGSRRSFRYRSKPSGGWHHWSHESLWHLGRSAREITAKGNFGMLVSGSMPLVSTPPWYWWLVGGLEHEFGLFVHFIYGYIYMG
jgi:hypothetical protein